MKIRVERFNEEALEFDGTHWVSGGVTGTLQVHNGDDDALVATFAGGSWQAVYRVEQE